MPENEQTTDPQALAGEFKKDELQTAAAVQGVDVPSGATKSDIAEAIVSATPNARPVVVDLKNRRSDDDAIIGEWVDVVSGPHAARFGAYFETSDYDPESGYPRRVFVRTRDARNEVLEVNYSDIRPSERSGGR